MLYEHRIIDKWPGPQLRVGHTRSPFKVDWSRCLDDLERELRHLGGRNVILETAHDERDLGMDGRVRVSPRYAPRHPGVVLVFDSKWGPLRYFTDVYDDWRANVRAVSLGLEYLRGVDRYGITSRGGEQYTGWAKLTAGNGQGGGGTMPAFTLETAREFIATCAGLQKSALVGAEPEILGYTYRMARKRVHPDMRQGQRDLWDQLEKAATLLEWLQPAEPWVEP